MLHRCPALWSSSFKKVVFGALLCALCSADVGSPRAAPDPKPTDTVPSSTDDASPTATYVLYPRARVHMLVFFGFFFTTVAIPAVLMLGYWFLIQVLGGLPQLASAGGGIAFWAHIGGFAAGVVLVLPFRRPEMVAAHRARRPRRKARYGF